MTNVVEADYPRYQSQILGIREQVFIVEQGVPVELEEDELDSISRHVLLFESDTAIATGRLTPDGHIGRIAVLKDYRNRGYGTQIIKKLESLAASAGLHQVKLGAQCQAVPFYERLNYQPVGEVFMDAGIEHRLMRKSLE